MDKDNNIRSIFGSVHDINKIVRDINRIPEKTVDEEISEMTRAMNRRARIDRFFSGYCPM